MSMIEYTTSYACTMGARTEVILWIKQNLGAAEKKGKVYRRDKLEHIIDYLVSPFAPKRLLKMSIAQAELAADKWSKSNQKKGRNIVDSDSDLAVIHEYPNGSRIVRLLTKDAFKREGFMMSHCLGGMTISPDIDIYSYRDKNNNPHATFEVRKNGGEITQIKGKGNGHIHPKYITPILDFLISIDKKPRPSEMKNLGYYHIDKAHHDFVRRIACADKFTIALHGELYAYA